MGLAENIKKLRDQFNLTQEEIAKIAGVSYQAVSSWERGEKSPRMGAIIRLAQHFGLKNSDLIDNDIDPANTATRPSDTESLDSIWAEQAQVLRRAGKIATPEERQRIANIIKATLGINDKGE